LKYWRWNYRCACVATPRSGSGGTGHNHGGEGFRREIQFLVLAGETLLTDRRKRVPYGLYGGEPVASGIKTLEHGRVITELPGKVTVDVQAGDVLSICTPGGGGFLPKEENNVDNSN
jgi:N-methylhydantoinase B/oxoprolinase/acetone carboxylase alpha subunit